MSASGKRIAGIVAVAAIVCVGIGLYIGLYLTNVPGSAAATPVASGGVNLHLATVAASETTDPNPSWVSYYAVDAHDEHWRHVTTYVLPAHTLVHVTIYQFDGQSGLRNPFIGQATGIVGGQFLLNGKPTRSIGPDTASHVFAIPEMGVSVPLEGIPDSAKN